MKFRSPIWIIAALLLVQSLAAFAQNAPAHPEEQKTDAATMPEKKADAAVPGIPVPNPFDAIKQFSAVQSGGIMPDEDRKVYRSGKLMRTDFKGQHRVTDIELPLTWVVMYKTDTKPETCSKYHMADAGDFPFYGLRDFKAEKLQGDAAVDEKETVDGHSCKIETLRFVKSNAVMPITIEMKLWEAEDLDNFPIKIEAHNLTSRRRFAISYRDVSLQKPDAKLFIHPEKCQDDAQKIQMKSKEADTAKAPTKATPATAPKPSPASPPQ